MYVRQWITASLALAFAACAAPAEAQTAASRDLDAFIGRIMEGEVVPSMAVAVVRGNEIVYAKGFGFADRERGIRATADTQFYIASTTKSFTAMAAAILDRRGALSLDLTLDKALPRARLHPQLVGSAITLRDLLTHTHGIRPGGPVDIRLAFTGEHSPDQLQALLKYHPPAANRNFAYSNLGYNIYGLVLNTRYSDGWQGVVQREVFAPLGMRSTTAFVSRADQSRLAQSYAVRAEDVSLRVYPKNDTTMQSAGGHVSTANDLARYLIANLNGGRLNGRQVISEEAIALTHRQQAVQNSNYGSYHRTGWGLGWDIASYGGNSVLQRFGAFSGFFSHVSFMPERRLGVVVLVNGSSVSPAISDAISTFAYDRFQGESGTAALAEAHWKSFTAMLANGRAAMAADLVRRKARPQITSLPLTAYAGVYESPAFGRMVWAVQNNRLHATLGRVQSDAEVYDGTSHQFRIELGGTGSVVGFTVPPGGVAPTEMQFSNEVFARVP